MSPLRTIGLFGILSQPFLIFLKRFVEFTHNTPRTQCMVYLLTFGEFLLVDVGGKYTISLRVLGM